MRGVECAYGFQDLFFAAFGRMPDDTEIGEFMLLDQPEKNLRVKEWAELAGWETQERVGDDRVVYTAFAPEWGDGIQAKTAEGLL